MSLIDADKYLEKVCTYKETGCGSCKLQTMCPKDAPTVKAILVEYIKAFKEEVRDVTNGKAVIEWLLEEWEKENGAE